MYVEGFVVAVPTANKDAYIKHAESAVPIFKNFGMTRMVECWGDDVPDGKVNDFKGAVNAKPDETVLFSWCEYPDKATRDAANEKMMADPDMQKMGEMPFDGKRMIFAGFEPMVEYETGAKPGYVDGYVLPVSKDNTDKYRAQAQSMVDWFKDLGATRIIEAHGTDVPKGEVTDYYRATHAEDGEDVWFSWVEWPDKATRDAGWKAMMEDDRMKDQEMAFDGKRMIYGGFKPIVDAG